MSKLNPNSNSSGLRMHLPVRLQIPQSNALSNEEDLVAGLTIQQTWQEKPEFSLLTANLLRLCRISPLDSSNEWKDVLDELESSINTYQFKIFKQMMMFKSKNEDANFLMKQHQTGELIISQALEDVEAAKQDLTSAKEVRQNREKYEKLAQKLVKHASISEIEKEKSVELHLKDNLERRISNIYSQKEFRSQQAALFYQYASEFKNLLSLSLSTEGS